MLKKAKSETKHPTLAEEKHVIEPAYGDLAWANETLRFAIATLQGKIEVSKIRRRISTCILLKHRLAEKGFWWQVKVLDAWIHRAQGGEFDGC